MTKILDENKLKKLEERVAQFEITTGAELIIAIAQNSDPYPAASLRLALVFGLLLSSISLHYIDLSPNMVLGLFVFFFLLSLPLGRIKKLRAMAISSMEASREVKEKAREVFYEQAIAKDYNTPVILIYTSLQEREVEIMAHQSIASSFTQNEWDKIINLSIPFLRQGDLTGGLQAMAQELEVQIRQKIPALKDQTRINNHSNKVILFQGF